MNGIVWNCRGAGGPNFPSLIRDYVRMHHLNFVALLETRISGSRAEEVCCKVGLQGCFRVEANGFSGGIWCLWNSGRLNISVPASDTYCVHLRVN